MEPVADGEPSSTLLLRFSGILGFSADCRSFLLARQYCPQLFPLIYIQRLLFLERALPVRAYATCHNWHTRATLYRTTGTAEPDTGATYDF